MSRAQAPTRQLFAQKDLHPDPKPTKGIVLPEPRPHPNTKWYPCVKQVASKAGYSGEVLHGRFQVLESQFWVPNERKQSGHTPGRFYIVDHDAPDGLHREQSGTGVVCYYDTVGDAEGAIERLVGTPPPMWKGWKHGPFREQLARQGANPDFTAASTQEVTRGGKPPTGGAMKVIYDGVVAGDNTETIYKRLKTAYPDTTYRATYVDWYRRQMVQRGQLPESVKQNMESLEMAKAAAKEKTPAFAKEPAAPKTKPVVEKAPRVTSGGRTRELLAKGGMTNDQIQTQLEKEGFASKPSNVGWYRSQMKKDGTLPDESVVVEKAPKAVAKTPAKLAKSQSTDPAVSGKAAKSAVAKAPAKAAAKGKKAA